MTSRRLALLVVGPDVVGGSQRCEVDINRNTTLEYLAKELESQIQFASPNCLISLVEVFDYSKGQYIPLNDVQRNLEDRARIRVRCARNVSLSSNDKNDDGSSTYHKAAAQYASWDNNIASAANPSGEVHQKVDRDLDARADEIRQRASSPEAKQRFLSSAPDHGGAVGRATMLGKPLPASSALKSVTCDIDGDSSFQRNQNQNGMSSARSNASDGSSLDQARRVGTDMSYLNGPIKNQNGNTYAQSQDGSSAAAGPGYFSPQREYQKSLIRHYQKQQKELEGQRIRREEEEEIATQYQRQQQQRFQQQESRLSPRRSQISPTRDDRHDAPHFSPSFDEKFHRAATSSMQSNSHQFSPARNNNNNNNNNKNNNNRSNLQEYQSPSEKLAQPRPRVVSNNNNTNMTVASPPPQFFSFSSSSLPESIIIFCVYNGTDGQRAKAISVNRKNPDLNVVLTTLESKFQLPLCLGYIDPETADCEEVTTQKQFTNILNSRSHMHDPNAGCTFQCWMKSDYYEQNQEEIAQQKFEESRRSNQQNEKNTNNDNNNNNNNNHQETFEDIEGENDFYSPDNRLDRCSVGRHPPSRPQSARGDNKNNSNNNNNNSRNTPPPVSTPPPPPPPQQKTSASVTFDRHQFNRNSTISPTKTTPKPENSATKISQYTLQRLQALEAEQARRDGGGANAVVNNSTKNINNSNNQPRSVGRRSQADARSVATTSALSCATVLITEDQLRETFDELDLDGSGFVPKAAMREWFDKNIDTMGVPGSDKKFEKMMATAKRRHELDYQEFCVVMLKIAQW